MQNALKKEIKRLSKKVLEKKARTHKKELEFREKFKARTGVSAGVSPRGSFFSLHHRHFDPYYCARNANFLAKTIWFKVLSSSYEPTPAIHYQIPKPDGDRRSIMAFSIPDAALANVVLKRVRARNLKKMSPHSYAYHPEKNVFDAILALKDFPAAKKMFAVQIDFEKYFDNIPSGYLKRLVDDPKFCATTLHERHIFTSFMHHRYAAASEYVTSAPIRRVKGTPQGASVSLFLANLANHELDTSLSTSAGKFVRFADDVVALSESYAHAQAMEEKFNEHCMVSGLKINKDKSPGIAIISPDEQAVRNYAEFDYLGYRFCEGGLSIPDKVVKRIKIKISRLTNIYLIQHPQNKDGFNPSRTNSSPPGPLYDWDLLGLISEIRGYMYGGLHEDEIRRFLENGNELRQMRGLMGFYALIEDKEKLRELDGWLVNHIRRAMRHRNRVLSRNYGISCITPSNRSLILGDWLEPSAWDEKKGDDIPDARLPSFVRGWRAARKFYFTFGLERVEPPNYFAYY